VTAGAPDHIHSSIYTSGDIVIIIAMGIKPVPPTWIQWSSNASVYMIAWTTYAKMSACSM
jgi:hypothetical protein